MATPPNLNTNDLLKKLIFAGIKSDKYFVKNMKKFEVHEVTEEEIKLETTVGEESKKKRVGASKTTAQEVEEQPNA